MKFKCYLQNYSSPHAIDRLDRSIRSAGEGSGVVANYRTGNIFAKDTVQRDINIDEISHRMRTSSLDKIFYAEAF